MSWDNGTRVVVGSVEDQTALNQRFRNMRQLKGTDAGQTEIEIQAMLTAFGWFRSTTDKLFDVRKRFTTADGGVASIGLLCEADLGAFPGLITDNQELDVDMQVGLEDGTGEEPIALWKFIRQGAASTGLLMLSALGGGIDRQNLTIDPLGNVGIMFPVPAYPLDVGAGTLNVVGDYMLSGTVINDWTVVPGTPNKVTWTGDAVVSRYWESSLVTGTAPLDVASTDECPYLDVELLADHGWHPGLFVTDSNTYTTTDDLIASFSLDTIGEWSIAAAVAVFSGDSEKEIQVKLKDGSGTQIGATTKLFTKSFTIGGVTYMSTQSVRVFGPYTSAAGNETIKVTCACPTGSGGTARALLFAHWKGP